MRRDRRIGRRIAPVVAVQFVLVTAAAHVAMGAPDRYWDSNLSQTAESSLPGTNAYWTTLTGYARWRTTTSGAESNSLWSNSVYARAVFGQWSGGGGGTISLYSNITASGMLFKQYDYNISTTTSSYVLTLNTNSAGQPTITVDPSRNASISAEMRGTSGFIKDGAGTLTINGLCTSLTGTIDIQAGTVVLGRSDRNVGVANLVVSGGIMNIGDCSDAVYGLSVRGGSVTGVTGVLTSMSTYDMQNGAVSAILGGSVGLNKTSGGTVTLAKANAYTGPTSVQEGTLLVNGSTSTSSTVTVSAGATLGGTGDGTTTGAVNGGVTLNSGSTPGAGGRIAPGSADNTPGSLTVKSATSFGTNSVLNIGIADASGTDTSAGTNWDVLHLGSISGSFAVTLNSFAGIGGGAGTPANLQANTNGQNVMYKWLIATATNAFTLSNITIDQNQPGFIQSGVLSHTWALSTDGSGKNLYVSYQYNAVPEATTLLLAVAGLMPVLMQRGAGSGRRERHGRSLDA